MKVRTRIAGLVGLLVVGATAFTVPVAHAQQPDPTTKVLAVVSPLAAEACSASGSATLLVPIVGGLAQDQLGKDQPVKLADVILNALGPVYVTCGSLPAADGRRCALVDGQIEAVWPAQLSQVGFVAPQPGGNVVDSLTAGLAVLGLGPQAALETALQCSIPARASAPDVPDALPPPLPPPGAPAPALVDDQPGDGLALPALGAVSLHAPLAQVPGAAVTTAAPTLATQTVAQLVAARVPGGVRLLQLVVALLLGAFLARAWFTSWRLARRS